MDREAECYAQNKAKEIGIDKSIIYIDKSGWKISKFIDKTIDFDFKRDKAILQNAIDYIRKLHSVECDANIKMFDTFVEAEKLMGIASKSKGDLFDEFSDLYEKVKIINGYLKTDNIGNMVLSHNDTYEPNYLFTEDNKLYLIDWEYAGMQDPHVDVAMFCIYSLYNKRQVDRLIAAYFTEGCSDEIRIKIYCYIAACGLLWSNWCEYKRNLGVEFGEYSLRQYRYAKDYYRIVQEELKKQGEEE